MASKVLYSFIYKVCLLSAFFTFSCSTEHEHSAFTPVPDVTSMDFEQYCLEKINETKSPFWYYRLAKVQYDKHQYKSALKNVSLALTDSATNLEYAKLKCEVLLKVEDYSQTSFLEQVSEKDMTIDQASRFAELAIRAENEPLYLKFIGNIDNQSDRYFYLQSLHYFYTGEKVKAISYLDKAMRQNPNDEELLKMYLQMLDKDGKKVQINELLRKYKDTNSYFFQKLYGFNLLDLDSTSKATAYLQKARKKDSTDVGINLALAELAFSKWDYDLTIAYAEQVLSVENNGKAHYFIAYSQMKNKFFYFAQKHLDEAKTLASKDENLSNEILMLERNMRYLQARRRERDTERKEDSIQ